MNTVNYQKVHAQRLARMTPEQRAEYDAAYEHAGLALRLAELFYDARTAAGLTQTELARRMGTTQPTIARIEGGGRIPTLDMLERLATAIGMQLDISLTTAA
ncbi:ribosome-binding protein aMBF1 (putative translation factor) [Nocardia kruczakiae]|uniref:Ribosome-binding protein aMBF1 (Putative translation factor) n=1 Tax=Nocardia kruczakiae TaxID=261477 RepID=A0ABU1XM86_9NOCA|nr:helix-turn-helix transcriptional regulator [Nocardia kruczakiae]MDR7171032.1 ribosome-binding protein aMBF1 (putative translation factor) [Nocardia kruczakiae]